MKKSSFLVMFLLLQISCFVNRNKSNMLASSSISDLHVEKSDDAPNFSVRRTREHCQQELDEVTNFSIPKSAKAEIAAIKKAWYQVEEERMILPNLPHACGSDDAKLGALTAGFMTIYYGGCALIFREIDPRASTWLGVASAGCCCLCCSWYACFYGKAGWCCQKENKYRMDCVKQGKALKKACIHPCSK